MADFVFNIAKGRVAYLASLPLANDALVVIPLQTSGIETDAVLRDKVSFADVVSGTTREQTTMGRKTFTSATVTVDQTNDRVDVDMADSVWSAATGVAISAIVVCYDDDTTSGTDASLIPLTKHDFVATPNGADITAVIAAAGFYRAS